MATAVLLISCRDQPALVHAVAHLVRRGRNLEKVVLARAVRAHLGHRALVHRNRTIVFG